MYGGFEEGTTGKEISKKLGAKEWVGPELAVLVLFDRHGRATMIAMGNVPKEESFIARLRRWLRL
jgi:hypothetical protein